MSTADADRTDDDAAMRYESVRATMDTALGTILACFRYTTRRPQSGPAATPSSTPPPADTPERRHARA